MAQTSSDRLERAPKKAPLLRRKKTKPTAKKRREPRPEREPAGPPPPNLAWQWGKRIGAIVLVAFLWAIGATLEGGRLDDQRAGFKGRAKDEIARSFPERERAELDALVERFHDRALSASFKNGKRFKTYEWDVYMDSVFRSVDLELQVNRRR